LGNGNNFKGISLPDISPIEFDKKNYAELHTPKSEEYEPASLRTMLGALHCYVKRKGYSTSIISSGKAISLREQGKGKMKRKPDSISDEDEEAMWESPMTGEVDYVEWVEGITKTRQGGLVKQQRRVPQ